LPENRSTVREFPPPADSGVLEPSNARTLEPPNALLVRSPMSLVIEPIRQEDLPGVLAIEVTSFSIPWTREMFENELARKDLSQMLVARLTGIGNPPPLAGYICHWVVGEELHVNNLAVDRRWRRRGIGGALLQAALEEGRLRGARCAFLEVRASNVAAQTLYLRHGFESAGIRRSYYDRPPEDALLMKRDRL